MGLALNFPTSPLIYFIPTSGLSQSLQSVFLLPFLGSPPLLLCMALNSPFQDQRELRRPRCPLRFKATEIMFFIKQVYFCRGGVLCLHPGKKQKETPPLRTGSLSPQRHVVFQPSLLGTKEVGIMKSQTSYQLFKVTQAPRWT